MIPLGWAVCTHYWGVLSLIAKDTNRKVAPGTNQVLFQDNFFGTKPVHSPSRIIANGYNANHMERKLRKEGHLLNLQEVG